MEILIILYLSAFAFTLAPSLCSTHKHWVCPLAAAKDNRGSPDCVVELASTPYKNCDCFIRISILCENSLKVIRYKTMANFFKNVCNFFFITMRRQLLHEQCQIILTKLITTLPEQVRRTLTGFLFFFFRLDLVLCLLVDVSFIVLPTEQV